MANSFFTMVFASMVAITLFISCFLLGFSFDTIDPNQMGFVFDANVMQLETDVLYNTKIDDDNGGRVFLGLGRSFSNFRYPRFAQRLLFASSGADSPLISAKTNDGLSITLSMSFQFHFMRSAAAMRAMAINYGTVDEAKALIIKFTRREVRDALSVFEVKQLWQARPNVTRTVREAVQRRLEQAYVVVTGLQLLDLTIPSEVREAVETTTVEEQKIEEARQQQLKAVVEVRTEQQQARQDAEVTVINAQAQSQKTIIDARAAALALNVTVSGQERYLKASRDNLKVSNSDLLEYLQMRSVLVTPADAKLAVRQPAATG